jgi:hypothetical protein
MSFSTTDLAILESAIAQGALKVKYSDKEITYRSLSEMLQIRAMMRASLGLVSGQAQRIKAEFSKGIISPSLRDSGDFDE